MQPPGQRERRSQPAAPPSAGPGRGRHQPGTDVAPPDQRSSASDARPSSASGNSTTTHQRSPANGADLLGPADRRQPRQPLRLPSTESPMARSTYATPSIDRGEAVRGPRRPRSTGRSPPRHAPRRPAGRSPPQPEGERAGRGQPDRDQTEHGQQPPSTTPVRAGDTSSAAVSAAYRPTTPALSSSSRPASSSVAGVPDDEDRGQQPDQRAPNAVSLNSDTSPSEVASKMRP